MVDAILFRQEEPETRCRDAEPAPELLSIGDVARIFGVRTSALRYYEKLGLLVPAERRANRRFYGPDELRRLALIQLCQRTGQLSLDDVAALIEGSYAGAEDLWRTVLLQQIARLDEQIERAHAAKEYLRHFAMCSYSHPISECPSLRESLENDVERKRAAHGAG
ncbi:MerR family transcriptional regulator [Saccharopolyspora taberi]|uniref:Helix-turn-helix domain-containing protein n=1 Tax=Saccharopolyspora taberi TaxID=60895 RepID=A0ABN3VAY3_9PSEU